MSNGDLFLILVPLYIIALNVSKKYTLTWHFSLWGLFISVFLSAMSGVVEILKDLK